MDEQSQKTLAAQLRQPSGEMGLDVAGHMNKGNAPMNRFGIKHLQIEANDHILEIGMGNGFFAREMLGSDPSVQYSGCDFSADMVEEAKKLNKDFVSQNRATFIHSPADTLPFEEDTFDKILTVNTIYFWDDPVKELTELRRVIRPGGRIVLVMRSGTSLKVIPFTKYGFHIYSRENVEQFFTKGGWKIEAIEELQENNQRYDGEVMLLTSWAVIARGEVVFK